MQKPNELDVGDVYTTTIGAKRRPVVICSVLKDRNLVLGIPISKTQNALNLSEFKSRFFGEGYFTKQIVTSTYKFAMENFIGVFEDTKQVKEATSQMKRFYAATL